MKKLLSLLSVLTISGSAVPTTIAASPYKKQEKLNSNINLQANNLVNLNRNKRENNNIFRTENLNFDFDVKEYFKNLCKIMKNLLDKKIIINVSDYLSDNENVCDSNYFSINSNSNYNYFIIPILFEGRDIQLVFRSKDFYLQGFTIVNNNGVPESLYYHFSEKGNLNNLIGYASRPLGFDGNYNTLMPDADQATVRWDSNITQAFWDIINYGDNPNSTGNIKVIKGALARVILATSESIRFRKARNSIINQAPSESTWGFYHSFLTRWKDITKEAVNYILQYGTLNGFWASDFILMFSSGMDAHLQSCNKKNKRDLNNNNEYCFQEIKKDISLEQHVMESNLVCDLNDKTENFKIIDLEFGEYNPYNYKIMFYERFKNEMYSKFTWDDEIRWGGNINEILKNINFKNHLKNHKFSYNDEEKIKEYANIEILNVNLKNSFLSWADGKINIGFTFYLDDNKIWHLQILIHLFTDSAFFSYCPRVSINLGQGVKLY